MEPLIALQVKLQSTAGASFAFATTIKMVVCCSFEPVGQI